jgi:hypothetical protein
MAGLLLVTSCAAEAAGAPSGSVAASAAAPAVTATAELDGQDVTIHVEVTGFALRFVAGDRSGATGHLHLFIDRAPVAAGGQIGFEEGIVHTVNRVIAVPRLSPGDHTIWVVVADGTDAAFDPLVATRLDVSVPE